MTESILVVLNDLRARENTTQRALGMFATHGLLSAMKAGRVTTVESMDRVGKALLRLGSRPINDDAPILDLVTTLAIYLDEMDPEGDSVNEHRLQAIAAFHDPNLMLDLLNGKQELPSAEEIDEAVKDGAIRSLPAVRLNPFYPGIARAQRLHTQSRLTFIMDTMIVIGMIVIFIIAWLHR